MTQEDESGWNTVTAKRKKKKKRESIQSFRNNDNRSKGTGNFRGRQRDRRGSYRQDRRDDRRINVENTTRRKQIPIGGSQYRAQHRTNRGTWSDQARPAPQPPPQKIQYEEPPPPVEPNPVGHFEENHDDTIHTIHTNEENPEPVFLEPIEIEQTEEPVKTTIEFQGLNSPDNPELAVVTEQPDTVVEPPVEPEAPAEVEEKKEIKAVFSFVKDEPSSPVGWSWMGGKKPKDPPALADSTPSDPLGVNSLDSELLKKTAIPQQQQVETPKKKDTPGVATQMTQPIPQPTVHQPWGYPNQHNPYMEAGFHNGPMMRPMQAGNPMGYVVPGIVGIRPQQYMMPIPMGASPGPMMQNHMAPGLMFNHSSPYYRGPVMVRNNHMGGGAGTNNAPNQNGTQTNQTQPHQTQSQNLLTYNAIPHNQVPVFHDYIPPSHKPRSDARKKQQRQKPKPGHMQQSTTPWFKNWEELFAYRENLDKSPVFLITKFLKCRDLYTKLFILNKDLYVARTQLPFLENLRIDTFSMFNINKVDYKYFGRENPVKNFFDQWSPLGLREVTLGTQALDDENFVILTHYLQRCPMIQKLTIKSVETEQSINETSQKNLKNLLRDIHSGHLVFDGDGFQDEDGFKIDGNFLKLLQDRISELSVLSEKFEWKPYLISQLPSRLSGLTICCPAVSWISIRDKLPSDLKRLYIRYSPRPRAVSDVEVDRLFQKLPHVQFDFSLLQSFVKPDAEIYTAIRKLDLFFDRDARPIFGNIFCNLPLSLRQFSISYTGHAHNALEGWWQTLSSHTVAHLEELGLNEFDGDGLEDTIRMFQAKQFPNLKRLLFVTIAILPKVLPKIEERLKAVLPETCELIVKTNETEI